MSKYISILAMFVFSVFSISAMASHSVRGYYRNDGTYVQPHMSMDPGEARSSGYSYHHNEIVPNNSYRSNSSGGYGYGMTPSENY